MGQMNLTFLAFFYEFGLRHYICRLQSQQAKPFCTIATKCNLKLLSFSVGFHALLSNIIMCVVPQTLVHMFKIWPIVSTYAMYIQGDQIGEFSLFGWLFSLGSFSQISEIDQNFELLFSSEKVVY
jgi:hypothetical protein